MLLTCLERCSLPAKLPLLALVDINETCEKKFSTTTADLKPIKVYVVLNSSNAKVS